MSKKTVLLLLAIAVALAAFVAANMAARGKNANKGEQRVLSLPEYESVSRIEISDFQDTTTIIRQQNEWSVNGKLADKKKIQTIWEEMGNLRARGPVARNPELHARFQTDEQNATTVSFFTEGEDPALKILLGKRAARFSEQYIRFDGEDTVWKLEKNVGFLVPANPSLWYDLTLVSLPPSEISSVSFSFPSETFTLSKKGEPEEGSVLWTLSLQGKEQDLKQEDLMDFFFALNPLRADRFADENEQSLFQKEKESFTISISSQQGEITVEIKKADDNLLLAASSQRQNSVFVLNKSSADGLLLSPESLLASNPDGQ